MKLLLDLEKLAEAIVNLDEKAALEISKKMIESGADPIEVLETCRKGMTKVGEKFEAGEYFLSDLVMAAEIFKEITEIIKPQLKRIVTKPLGKIVIGTVQGDIHDIGKNIVKALLEAEGFDVVDLGVDVPPEKFVEAIKEYKPDIVGMSGLLTLAIESMKKTADAIKNAGLRDKVKIIIGGGRADEEAKNYVGADAWSDEAAKGVKLCKEILGR